MEIELTNTNWVQITGLDDGTTYSLQAKRQVDEAGSGNNHTYILQNILYVFQ